MQLLTKTQMKALVEGVWSGKYDRTQLPAWLFNALADGFEGAAIAGWGNDLGKGALKDIALELSMQENIYYFAAHKTAHELKDMHQVLLASKNKFDFVKRALTINDKYNRSWYETEYNVTTRIARAGREWRTIEENKDEFPKLKFIAVQDGNQRAEHQALHGIIRPVDDPFWKTYFPPLDWNCRCRVAKLTEGEDTSLKGIEKPPVIEQFRERVTDSQKIWSEKHPYFSGLSESAQQSVNELVFNKR